MFTALAIQGYRSIRDLVLPLAPLTVVTGANGTGKSSLYRAVRLLAATAHDGAVASLAREGGLTSTLWAGPEHGTRPGRATQGTVRTGPIGLRLGLGADDDGLGYAIDLGIPVPSRSMFAHDPQIKVESVWAGPVLRPATELSRRRGPVLQVRDGRGWRTLDRGIDPWTSMVAELGDGDDAPEVARVRAELRRWRFYDTVRTDPDAPARHESVGTRTAVLASDGADLPAAWQTTVEAGFGADLDAAVDRAFPGSRVEVVSTDGRFGLHLHQPGLLRPLSTAELSDGTLRYLIWVAALSSTRPAPLLVLNEPETSLHPELLTPLAERLAAVAGRSQVLVVSHSARLVEALDAAGALTHELVKRGGETALEGQGLLDSPRWAWPER